MTTATVEKPDQESLAEKFRKANALKKQKDEQAKKEKEASDQKKANPSAPRTFTKLPPIKVLPIHNPAKDNETTVFRVIGLPHSVRENPWDVKQVFFSYIVGDDGRHHRFVWPQNKNSLGQEDGTLDKSFILYKIQEKVLDKGKWDESIDHVSANGHKGFWTLPFKDTESYKWIKGGVNMYGYSKFFVPSKVGAYVMNVISRMDDWCAKNKHTMLLGTKDESYLNKQTGEMVTKMLSGITSSLYGDIYAATAQFHDHWDIDVAIEKEKVIKDGVAKPVYKVRKPSDLELSDEVRALFANEGKFEILKGKIVPQPLTAEEQAYEKYDLDRLFKPNYFTIKQKLQKRIETVDEETGSSFMQELESLIAQQKEERAKSGVTAVADEASDDSHDDDEAPF